MTALWIAAFAALVLPLLETTAASAAPLPAVAGDRVRVTMRDSSSVLGRLLGARNDGLEIASEPDSLRRTIPPELLAGLEVERLHDRAGRGAVIGLLVGALAGHGAGSAIHHFAKSGGDAPGSFVLIGGLGGAALGAVLGEGSRRTTWEPAALPAPAMTHLLEPGNRVRVTILTRAAADSLALPPGIDSGERVTALLRATDPRSILLAIGDSPADTLRILRSQVGRLEQSSGRRSRTGKGAGLGFLIGVVSGVGVGLYLEAVENPSKSSFPGRGTVPLALGIGGALVGLGVGAIVGAAIHTETWRPAELPPAR